MNTIETAPTIDLIKPLGEGKKNFTSFLNQIQRLWVGGREGEKFQLIIKDVAPRFGNLQFITKEYDLKSGLYTLPYVLNIIRAYKKLYSQGYPVPATARYFEKDDKVYLTLSDMTEGGKKLIWGYNDRSSREEIEQLAAMRLTTTDIQEINTQALTLAKKATDDGHWLKSHYFHIRKDKQTSKLDLVLLDIHQYLTLGAELNPTENIEQVEDFIVLLQGKLSQI